MLFIILLFLPLPSPLPLLLFTPMAARPHLFTTEPSVADMLAPGEQLSEFDTSLRDPGGEIQRMERSFPVRAPPGNPIDVVDGTEHIRKGLNMDARQNVFDREEFNDPTLSSLDTLDNAYSKTLKDFNAAEMKLVENFVVGKSTMHDEGDDVDNNTDPTAQIMMDCEVLMGLYDGHNLFQSYSLARTIQLFQFVFTEHVNFGGLNHVRDLASLNWVLEQMKMPYGQLKRLMWDGSIPQCFWPRTTATTMDERNPIDIPQFDIKDKHKSRRNWGFASWNLFGYIGSDPFTDSDASTNVYSFHRKGLFNNVPNYWNMSLVKPAGGLSAWFMLVLRVDELGRQRLQRETEMITNERFVIYDNEQVKWRLEPVVAPSGQSLPQVWYDNENYCGKAFHVGIFNKVSDPSTMEKCEASTRSAIFPGENGTTTINTSWSGIDRLSIYLNLNNS